jgi:protein phosphatase
MTHKGRVRQNNEDAFLALTFDGLQPRFLGKTGEAAMEGGHFVFAVSDGMGGAAAGEFASRVAVDKITRFMAVGYKLASKGPSERFDGLLSDIFASIHKDLLSFGWSYPECAGMGTTLSVCWFTPLRLHFAHVGDSRIYQLPQKSHLRQLTHDHSHVGWLRRTGKLSELEARVHPHRNALSQALGAGQQFVEPQIETLEWKRGDRYLICSDGVVEGLWDRRLEEVLEAPAPIQGLAAAIVTEAVNVSGGDNATAVVVEVLQNR